MADDSKRKPAKSAQAKPPEAVQAPKKRKRRAPSKAPSVAVDATPVAERINGRSTEVAQDRLPWLASEVSASAEDSLQLVTFVVDSEEYGFPIMRVQEILRARVMQITPIPNAPFFIEGVMNLRGRVIPVVGLRRRFGLPDIELSRTARVVVVDVAGRVLAVSVDEVREVVMVDAAAIESLPDLAATTRSAYIVGVARTNERMVIVLDMDMIFSAEEKTAIDDLTAGTRGDASCV